jgi:predicted PolB exonuclease-like 3'-5' exonuclease
MLRPHIVFDIETVLDEDAVARAHKLAPGDVEAVRAAIGDTFPKPAFHKIVAIAAAALTYGAYSQTWSVLEMATLHTGDQTEKELVGKFVDYVRRMTPTLVGYNSLAFDLPVVRARAMLYRQGSWHMAQFNFRPFSEHHVDLCDLLAGRSRTRMTLDEAVRTFGIGAKTEGMDGSKVEDLAKLGAYQEIADYCLDDVVATASLFLLHETFAGRLDEEGFERARQGLVTARDITLRERPDTFICRMAEPLVDNR